MGPAFFLPQGDLRLVVENPSIYLFRFGPASCVLALAAPDWTLGCYCLLPCGPLASTGVRECAALWAMETYDSQHDSEWEHPGTAEQGP